MSKEKIIREIDSFLSDYSVENIDSSTDFDEVRAYLGDAQKLIKEVKRYFNSIE